jgi:hypothetical protein
VNEQLILLARSFVDTDILPEYFAYIPIKVRTHPCLFNSTIPSSARSDVDPPLSLPSQMDFTDIPSVLAFFKGDPATTSSSSSSTTLVRDEVARRVAHNGRCWVQRTWRKGPSCVLSMRSGLRSSRTMLILSGCVLAFAEDMVAYMFRFYLEWARIQGDEGDL